MILISGLGLLFLTMTNRLGRVIDRSRSLLDNLESYPESYILRIIRRWPFSGNGHAISVHRFSWLA